ncbi:SMC family ATPase [Nonomuraea sp. NPDC050404]|uniref:SMC family ATPase n=1 Tax=Nonomuraea sp. NPDC050404 TaxID=3155783 RepID=UPI0033DA9261
MRPLRLRLDNFGSFREPVTADFSDVEYFVLVGPTGAGKSTLIDAICFALYGTVPRWGSQNVIAHALAPSAIAAKVALVFETAGRRYAVVRALKRDAKGKVHTAEARLDELDPAVPADAELDDLLEAVIAPVAEGAAVTAEVQRITGLEYRFFTQCVVLPQGRFAEFLHAQPRERQDLLVQLLDADVYERIRQRAVQDGNVATQAAGFARERLARLTDADEAAERAATAGLAALRTLDEQVRGELEALRTSDEQIARLSEEREVTKGRLAALTALAMPRQAPTLAENAREAAKEVAARTADAEAADAAEQRAEDELAALDDPGLLMGELKELEEHERVVTELREAETRAAKTRAALEPLAAEARACEAALAGAKQDRDRLRDAHAGAELARRLVVGQECPACLRPVEHLPHHPEAAGLREAERRVKARETESERARTRHTEAETQTRHWEQTARELAARLQSTVEESTAARAETTQEQPASDAAAAASDDAAAVSDDAAAGFGGAGVAFDRAGVEERLAADRAAVEERLAGVRGAERRAARLRQAARDARTRLTAARNDADELTGRTDRLWRDLETARDTVVPLGAPPLERADLHDAWTGLLAWRDEAAVRERSELTAQDERVTEAKRRAGRTWSDVVSRLSAHGVDVPDDAPAARLGELLVAAIARAQAHLARVRENCATARELDERAAAEEERARVAKELAQCLRADAFERWLCTEALDLLVTAASGILRELSDGQYELALGGRNEIEVIDHAEAGMRRNARTLSGGETFQAALALALALSDQVAGLSATAARSLDSLFLDEGFGSLDPAALDTVATTLERLAGGRERMVGVITHVPALADRIPVRFEVWRDAKGSHLCRTTT